MLSLYLSTAFLLTSLQVPPHPASCHAMPSSCLLWFLCLKDMYVARVFWQLGASVHALALNYRILVPHPTPRPTQRPWYDYVFILLHICCNIRRIGADMNHDLIPCHVLNVTAPDFLLLQLLLSSWTVLLLYLFKAILFAYYYLILSGLFDPTHNPEIIAKLQQKKFIYAPPHTRQCAQWARYALLFLDKSRFYKGQAQEANATIMCNVRC